MQVTLVTQVTLVILVTLVTLVTQLTPVTLVTFLLLGFHLPVREKWANVYKSVSQHNYLSIFLKILSFFR